ncbi:tetratricopeptide repeat protein [Kitasatospora sp. MAP5-34]|uniref:ATP-binding protein n=1 Tax=Kitasatospora sp. MAP5-34 TaxID=3035102 RepID=UPI0024747BD6|nr:tetratricopeptide repeat protein [Kitasatospora sp. MAP5-34]
MLREHRLRAGLTQEGLAERAGVSTHAISTLESGKRQPRPSSVTRLATAFELDPAQREQLIAAARRGVGRSSDPAVRVDGEEALPVAAVVPRMLPFAAPDFTGRSGEVDHLVALAADQDGLPGGTVVISAIDGMAGVGKTTLAVQVCHALAERFPDGQLFVDLHGFTPGKTPLDPSAALAVLLRAVGVGDDRIPSTVEERAQSWRSELAYRRVLLVLDNAVDAAQVRPLIPAGRGSLVLVTSRRRMPALAGATALSLAVLGQDEAVELFTRIVGPERVAGHPQELAEIVTACGLLPLAIRIAAARLAHRPAWTPVHLLARLRRQHRPLTELSVQDQSVDAAFAMSYHALAPEQRRLFALAALHPGDAFTVDAFAALTDLPPADAEDLLDELHDHHLLTEHLPGRFTFHDLIRQFAVERLAEDVTEADREAASDRLLTWYLHTSAAASRVLNPSRRHVCLDSSEQAWRVLDFPGYDDALAWLETEGTNLLAAAAQATRTGRHEIGWKLPITMWDLFHSRSQFEGRVDCNESALVSARALGDLEATAWVLNILSGAYQAADRQAEAADCLLQALEIRSRLGDVHGQASCLINLGYVHIELGRAAEAVGMLERALGIFRDTGRRSGEAAAHTNLGEAHMRLGNLATALDHHREALTIHLEVSDQFRIGRERANLAEILCRLGRLDEAAEQATLAHAANRDSGNRLDEAIALNILGQVHAADGRRSLAEQNWRHAHAILTDLGSPRAAEVGARLGTPG